MGNVHIPEKHRKNFRLEKDQSDANNVVKRKQRFPHMRKKNKGNKRRKK